MGTCVVAALAHSKLGSLLHLLSFVLAQGWLECGENRSCDLDPAVVAAVGVGVVAVGVDVGVGVAECL